VNISPGVIDIQHGCRGDGNSNTIDLILKVQGNGRTKGGTFDAIKVHHDPHDIQTTGYANCGPRNSSGHQDGAQIMGGNTIASSASPGTSGRSGRRPARGQPGRSPLGRLAATPSATLPVFAAGASPATTA
jgi:hypothetical protein